MSDIERIWREPLSPCTTCRRRATVLVGFAGDIIRYCAVCWSDGVNPEEPHEH